MSGQEIIEIGRMPHEMTLRGVPALAVQLARRKTVDGRDQLIMRVESPLEDVAHITEVALAVLRLNHYLETLLSGDELLLPLIEVYRPGGLRTGRPSCLRSSRKVTLLPSRAQQRGGDHDPATRIC